MVSVLRAMFRTAESGEFTSFRGNRSLNEHGHPAGSQAASLGGGMDPAVLEAAAASCVRSGDAHGRAMRLEQLQREKEKAAAEAAAAKQRARAAAAEGGGAGGSTPPPGSQAPLAASFAEGGLFAGVPTNFADVD